MAFSDTDSTAFKELLHRLELAWNAGDGEAFGSPMAEDADFVTIRGDHLRGRKAIVDSHRGIFSRSMQGATTRSFSSLLDG